MIALDEPRYETSPFAKSVNFRIHIFKHAL